MHIGTGVSTTTNIICIQAAFVQTAQPRIISITVLLSVLCSRQVLLKLKLGVGRYDHDVVGALSLLINPGMVIDPHFLAAGYKW
jgi:hypothetical protein